MQNRIVDIARLLANSGTPLHYAAFDGDTDKAQALIADGADIHAKSSGDYTPLHFAAMKGHAKIAKMLIERDPVVVRAKDEHGNTPLHYAEGFGHTKTATVLIGAGSDIMAKNKEGDSPSDIAEKRRRLLTAQAFRRQTNP